MRTILNCTNLLGDSLYLLRPVYEFLHRQEQSDVCCVVSDVGLPFELFSSVLSNLELSVYDNIDFAKKIYPDAVVLDLNAGRSGELCFRLAREKGVQLHISEGYAAILGINLGVNIEPPMWWQQVNEPLERTFFAISPFSRSCSRHSGERPNKTLDDHKWEYIIRFLRRQGKPVKVIAGPNDQLTNCSVPLNDYFTARNLYELEYFLKSCALLISVDNGLGHIASILQTPMISLWPQVSNLQFIAPRFSDKTAFIQMGDPNLASPVDLLQGIRNISRILLGESSDEDQTESEKQGE